jgi:hypothetical protein
MKSISLITIIILIIAVIVIIVGIYYGYNKLNNAIIYVSFNSNNYPITIYNTQSIPTPSPFQQDIAICNGDIDIGPNFAYINNQTLFNEINPNGQNVLFFNPNRQLLYSWYEGQLVVNNTYCDVWWVNIPQGIPANSNMTIYMHIGDTSSNYYQQYYPYVGTNAQVIGTMQYDNGKYVFIAYGYFNNTSDGWGLYNTSSLWSPIVTPNGIEMTNGNSQQCGGTYILPPNNWNIPEIPLIVEEAWYFNSSWYEIYVGTGGPLIYLFGNTNNQISGPTPNLSTYAFFWYHPTYGGLYLDTAITGSSQTLSSTSFPFQSDTVYGYLIVNSTYAETGYYILDTNQVWVPLTILNTYMYNVYNYDNIYNGISGYTYSNLNYNPYQYPTLELSGACASSLASSNLYIEWVIARAYPPNGVMPSIYIS